MKPSSSSFVEPPFTSESSEFNELASKGLQYGYLPVSDITQQSRLASLGYTLSPCKLFGFDFWVENFNNPVLGPVFRQLYFRQALQHLVDETQWIKSFLHGLAVPTYSPVPTGVANPFADSLSKTGIYGFSVAQAKQLLVSHGWKVVPNGVSTCIRPGMASNECGAGVSAGTALTIPLLFASGTTSLAQEMQAYKSVAAQVGIQINLSEAPFSKVIASKAPSSGPTCTWGMANWGGGWSYGPDYSPTGGELFSSGVRVGFSKVVPETVTLIDNTHTAPPSESQAALDAYQNFMIKEAPVVYQPYPPYQLSEIASNLKGVDQSPYGNLTPEYWYYTKS
ncbi:ABC transporter substrate-binding protein [Ferrithrix thermotolerans]|uniref:ABC transporter substrate-binding protein n=1 Tax=Ferrithrix thermotolerans TaxID=209649 RepID=UPI000A02E5EB|nr:ABC transporter substrate-binding protein [Ferrithrix thermotolerans]